MNRHCLTEIDLEARTALCSVCGPTEIDVTRPRTGTPSQVSCVQQQKPAGRPMHILKEIDEQKRSAVCAICGQTDVYRFMERGRALYRCATAARERGRLKVDAHPVNPFATVHILSHINEEKNTALCAKCGPVRLDWNSCLSYAASHPDAVPAPRTPKTRNKRAQENTVIVYEHKRRQACRRCGSMAIVDPYGFSFFEMHLPHEQRIAVFVEKAEPEELIAELEKRDLYCKKCLWLVNNAFANNTPIPEYRPLPTFF